MIRNDITYEEIDSDFVNFSLPKKLEPELKQFINSFFSRYKKAYLGMQSDLQEEVYIRKTSA